MDWQPIETAPKDGTRVLICDADGSIYVAQWDSKFSASWDDELEDNVWSGAWTDYAVLSFGYEEYRDYQPTHWMHLPEPPK